MPKIEALLKRLMRRLKQHMDAGLIATGIFFMGWGLYLLFERPQLPQLYGMICTGVGMGFWLAGYILAYIRARSERQKRIIERNEQQAKWIAERMEFRELFVGMIEGQRAMLAELKRGNRTRKGKR
jgi:hypothetical protein